MLYVSRNCWRVSVTLVPGTLLVLVSGAAAAAPRPTPAPPALPHAPRGAAGATGNAHSGGAGPAAGAAGAGCCCAARTPVTTTGARTQASVANTFFMNSLLSVGDL